MFKNKTKQTAIEKVKEDLTVVQEDISILKKVIIKIREIFSKFGKK